MLLFKFWHGLETKKWKEDQKQIPFADFFKKKLSFTNAKC
jgi:hypothetical protein